jgi:hypothetical protein
VSGSRPAPRLGSLLSDIADEAHGLGPERGERGPSNGRYSSTLASRQAPANLDAIVLRDPRTGVLAVTSHWAGRIRWHRGLDRAQSRSVTTETALIAEHWDWACEQPWGPQMVTELTELRDALYHARHGVHLRMCPVCGEPVRVDRFVSEHRDCIGQVP